MVHATAKTHVSYLSQVLGLYKASLSSQPVQRLFSMDAELITSDDFSRINESLNKFTNFVVMLTKAREVRCEVTEMDSQLVNQVLRSVRYALRSIYLRIKTIMCGQLIASESSANHGDLLALNMACGGTCLSSIDNLSSSITIAIATGANNATRNTEPCKDKV